MASNQSKDSTIITSFDTRRPEVIYLNPGKKAEVKMATCLLEVKERGIVET